MCIFQILQESLYLANKCLFQNRMVDLLRFEDGRVYNVLVGRHSNGIPFHHKLPFYSEKGEKENDKDALCKRICIRVKSASIKVR